MKCLSKTLIIFLVLFYLECFLELLPCALLHRDTLHSYMKVCKMIPSYNQIDSKLTRRRNKGGTGPWGYPTLRSRNIKGYWENKTKMFLHTKRYLTLNIKDPIMFYFFKGKKNLGLDSLSRLLCYQSSRLLKHSSFLPAVSS